MFKKYSEYPYIFWSIFFIVFPLLLVIYYSFITLESGSMTLSLKGYQTFFKPIYIKIFIKSIFFAFLCTFVCLLLGYPLAYYISTKAPTTQRILALLLILPMWMNFLLRTYSWINILGNNGILNKFLILLGLPTVKLLFTDIAILLGMVYNFMPFMVLPIYTMLVKLDKNIIEAAKDLGANNKEVFTKIIFPLSIPGIISGITMVFMPAVSTFVIPSLLGGGRNILIGNIIEQQFMVAGNWHFGSSISVVLMIFILVSVAILRRYGESVE